MNDNLPLGAAASQVISAITFTASSDEGRITVYLSPKSNLYPFLANCEVSCPHKPCTSALRLVREKCVVAHIWFFQGQLLQNNAFCLLSRNGGIFPSWLLLLPTIRSTMLPLYQLNDVMVGTLLIVASLAIRKYQNQIILFRVGWKLLLCS